MLNSEGARKDHKLSKYAFIALICLAFHQNLYIKYVILTDIHSPTNSLPVRLILQTGVNLLND